MNIDHFLLEKYSSYDRKYFRYLLCLYVLFCLIIVWVFFDRDSDLLLFMTYEQAPNVLKELSDLLITLLIGAVGFIIAILIAINGLDKDMAEQMRKIMYYEEYKGRPEHHLVALLSVSFITVIISDILCGVFSAMAYDTFDLSMKIFARTCFSSCILSFMLCGFVYFVLFKYLNTIVNAMLVFKFIKNKIKI